MWLAIKDLYTDVKAQVLYSGEPLAIELIRSKTIYSVIFF